MLVEMGIGDSYGCAFEFVKPPYALINDGATYQNNPQIPLGGGRYTDDTQMSLAIAELMLSNDLPTKEQLADKFVEVFKRDERSGYGSKFYELLKQSNNGTELLAAIIPDSTRSGGAMRAGVCGLYGNLDKALLFAKQQASVTHDTPEGHMTAQAVAAMSHYFAHDRGPKALLGSFLEATVPGWAWSEDWTEWATVMGIPCTHAAITAVRNGSSLQEVLMLSVSVGGDVDTVAAIAMFAASLCPEIKNDLPDSLYDGLENGEFGKDYLMKLDRQLFNFIETQKHPDI
jgi:ADP-ribosyl-[dinitrogen reductase] hydrolase